MGLGLGAVLGLGAAQTVLGGISGNKANKANKKTLDQLRALWAAERDRQNRIYREGFGFLTGAGESAKTEAKQLGQQAEARGISGLQQSGLINSTLQTGLRNSVANSTAQNLARVDEQIGMMKANYLQGLAGAHMGVSQGLSGALSNVQHTASSPNLAPWAWMLGGGGAGAPMQAGVFDMFGG